MQTQTFNNNVSYSDALEEWHKFGNHRAIYDIYEYFVHVDHHPIIDKVLAFPGDQPNLGMDPHFKYDCNIHSFEHRVSLRTCRVLVLGSMKQKFNLNVHSILPGDIEIRPEDNVPIHKVQSSEEGSLTAQTSWSNSSLNILIGAIENKREYIMGDFLDQLASLQKIEDHLRVND